MASKFDFIGAIVEKGFEKVGECSEFNSVYVKYAKHYERKCDVAWYGEGVHSLDVTIYVAYYKGEPHTITACFSSGKEKSYQYGKTAFNAIAETIRWNGFQM